MGKQGPCCHCGVASTPLWRNGPPDKPVLCNACGSRWRTKGSLTNYAPLHARAEPDNFGDHKESRIKITFGRDKEAICLKRKRTNDAMSGSITSNYNDSFWKAMDDNTSNRSSSGSAISNSESCAQFGTIYVNDLTGPAQAVVGDRMKPAKKRTCILRPKSSSIATLTKDLHTILHQQQSSGFSGYSEEDLLFESDKSLFDAEIGHGSYLIRDTSSITREEDSEASSFSVNNKPYLGSEICSYLKPFPVHTSSIEGMANTKMSNNPGRRHEKTERNTVQSEISGILGSQSLALTTINLKDVLNDEEFLRHLTNEEQEQLLKCLPFVDDSSHSSSLQSLFDSSHFADSFSSFQKLITEEVFGASLPGVRSDDWDTFNRLALRNLIESKSVELFNVMKKCKGSAAATMAYPETKPLVKIPNKAPSPSPVCQEKAKAYDIDNESACSSLKNLLALPSDSYPYMLNSLSYADENCDQDLLLDLPSSNSFPEAELIFSTPSFRIPQDRLGSCSACPSFIGQ